MSTKNYRNQFRDVLERTVLPEGITIEERNNLLLPLSKYIYEHLPSRLFRYRECSEMNFDAFNEDKLFAVTSDKFNDPYDCLFRYDKEGLKNSIIMGMSKDMLFAMREHFRSGGDFPELLNYMCDKELLNFYKDSIINASDDKLNEYVAQTNKIKEYLNSNFDKLAEEATQSVKRLAFIACFSETINSVTMWAHYANSHYGFALEYDTKDLQLKCQFCDNSKFCNKAAVCNLYPVIYQQLRYDATDFLGWYVGRRMEIPLKNPDTSVTLKALLYKSSQWSYEKEWRLIISELNEFQDKSPFCISHLKPKSIYYGSRISPINKKLLHMIAVEKGIKEYQMYIDHMSCRYSIKAKRI